VNKPPASAPAAEELGGQCKAGRVIRPMNAPVQAKSVRRALADPVMSRVLLTVPQKCATLKQAPDGRRQVGAPWGRQFPRSSPQLKRATA